MRLVFAGTPEPALPALRRLIASPRHDVIAVADAPRRDFRAPRQTDPVAGGPARRRRGRPGADTGSAELHGIRRATDRACAGVLRRGGLRCAAAGRAAGGARARLGEPAFLVAAGLAGAAPVQAAIAAGDAVTGATTFRIERDLDSGPVYGVVTETIRADDTAGELLQRLSLSGAALFESTTGRDRRWLAGRGATTRGRYQHRAEDHRRRRARALGNARPRRRAPHPRRHTEPGCVDDDRRRSGEDRPGHPGTGRPTLPIGCSRAGCG